MLNNKIIEIRKYLDLTQTQVSRFLNLSSYKYKWFEESDVEFPIETILILSLLYCLPIDYLISDKYPIDTILSFDSIQELKRLEFSQRLQVMKDNIVSCTPYKRKTISYRSISNIINKHKKNFSKNLEKIRTEQGIEIYSMSEKLNISEDDYLVMESGILLPDKLTLLILANILSVDIKTLFE